MKLKKICVFISILGIIVPIYASPSYAQDDADRALREVDRPFREEAEKELWEIPKAPPKIKEEERPVTKGPTFFVKKIKLIGCESFPPEDFRDIIAKYENKDLSINDLNILGREIQREYLKRGVIAVCFPPPQDVKNETVTLRVVEARMGDLEILDHSFFDKEILRNYWSLKKGEILRYDKMSRSLQLMNKNPDRDVNATLHAGKEPGTTDVLLKTKTHFPIHLTGSLDNEGSPTTGRVRKGVGIKDNNFLFVDDSFLFGYIYGDFFMSHYAFHRVPITNFGTSVMYGYSFSKAASKKDYEPLGLSSRSENYSVFVYQDIFRKADYLGELFAGLDAKDKTVKQTTGTINRDRLRILRLGANLIFKGPGNITYVSPQFSQGINGLGARRKNPLSSRTDTNTGGNNGIENTFSIFNLSVTHKRALPLDLQMSLKFKGQVSSEKLPSQEEFYVGGINSVRGYPSGDFLADNAFQTNAELLIPAFIIPRDIRLPFDARPLRDNITGLLFTDYAYGYRKGRMPGGDPTTKYRVNFASVGAGLRIRIYDQAVIRLEWGIPVGWEKPITETAPSRLHFSLDFEERLPEQIERMQKELAEKRLERSAWAILDRQMQLQGSPLAKELNGYMSKAQAAQERGELKEAKKYYNKAIIACNKLYRQSENYLRGIEEKKGKLEQENKLAMDYYKKGKLIQAKETWKKIEKESEIEPAVFEI